jgi:hypothetical protein
MNYNLHSGSMKQSRQNIFEQNPCLMKISAKSVVHWASLLSKALITKDIRETESVCKLHSMVNKNYLQLVGLVSSGQQTEQRKVNCKRIAQHCHNWKHILQFSQTKWICSEGLFPTQEKDVLKQIQAIFHTRGLPGGVPTSAYPDSYPPT